MNRLKPKLMIDRQTDLLDGLTSKEILGFLTEHYPEGWKAYGLKWEGRSVKQWQAGRKITWKSNTKGKWAVYCPLTEVKLLDLGNRLELRIGNISQFIN